MFKWGIECTLKWNLTWGSLQICIRLTPTANGCCGASLPPLSTEHDFLEQSRENKRLDHERSDWTKRASRDNISRTRGYENFEERTSREHQTYLSSTNRASIDLEGAQMRQLTCGMFSRYKSRQANNWWSSGGVWWCYSFSRDALTRRFLEPLKTDDRILWGPRHYFLMEYVSSPVASVCMSLNLSWGVSGPSYWVICLTYCVIRLVRRSGSIVR